jgi:hypothetical protein
MGDITSRDFATQYYAYGISKEAKNEVLRDIGDLKTNLWTTEDYILDVCLIIQILPQHLLSENCFNMTSMPWFGLSASTGIHTITASSA